MATFGRRRRHEGAVVRVDLNGLLPAAGPVAAADSEESAGLVDDLDRLCRDLHRRRSTERGATPPLPAELRSIDALAASIRNEFETLVVLGPGDEVAAIGALVDALHEPGRTGGGRRVVLADSADPGAMEALLSEVDLHRTAFNVVSASGGGPETVAQFLVVRDRLLRELGGIAYRRHVIVTTHGTSGPLRQIVADEGFRDVALEPRHARRTPFDALTLFPAAVAGIDVDEVVAGAVLVEERCRATDHPLGDPPSALASALWWRGGREGSGTPTVRSYCERLTAAAEWFAPRWRRLAAGRGGMTLFLRVEDHGSRVRVPAAYQDLEDVRYLGGHSLGALVNAEQRATEMSLALRGQPSATITLPVVSAFTLGQLMQLLEDTLGALASLAGVADDGRGDVVHDLLDRKS